MGLELFTQDQTQGRQVAGATFAKQAGCVASFECRSGEVFSFTDNQCWPNEEAPDEKQGVRNGNKHVCSNPRQTF